MRRAYLAAAAVVVAAAVTGYAVLPASDTQDAPEPVSQDEPAAQDAPEPTEVDAQEPAGTGPADLAGLPVVSASEIESAVIPQGIADSNNDFAADIYREISGGDENVFFSPLSIYTAFSLLYEGAEGSGAEELGGTFGFEPDARARHNATAHAMASINRDDPHAELVMANALWPVIDKIRPEYIDVGRSTYLAKVADPGESTVDGINGWVSDTTNGKIPEIIDELGPNTLLVITNAIYFKGTWEVQFPPRDTAEGAWHGDSGGTAHYMRIKDVFGYAAYDGLQVLKMPYNGDRLSMVVLLPDPGGMGDLEESLSAELLREWTGGLRGREVDVSLPKFTASTKYDLKDPLKSLGVNGIFKEGSLEGISERALVSAAVHAAFVDVNEEGTEAAAATAITTMLESMSLGPEFVADRPFLFLIRDDESGTMLFMGRVSEPSRENTGGQGPPVPDGPAGDPHVMADDNVIRILEDAHLNICEECPDDAHFDKAYVAAPRGLHVTWFNDSPTLHGLASGSPGDGPDGAFETGPIMPGGTYSLDTGGLDAGQYGYYCIIHPWERGWLEVRDAPEPAVRAASAGAGPADIVGELERGHSAITDIMVAVSSAISNTGYADEKIFYEMVYVDYDNENLVVWLDPAQSHDPPAVSDIQEDAGRMIPVEIIFGVVRPDAPVHKATPCPADGGEPLCYYWDRYVARCLPEETTSRCTSYTTLINGHGHEVPVMLDGES